MRDDDKIPAGVYYGSKERFKFLAKDLSVSNEDYNRIGLNETGVEVLHSIIENQIQDNDNNHQMIVAYDKEKDQLHVQVDNYTRIFTNKLRE